MMLNTLRPASGAHRRRKRIGRGPGSGIGKTGGRGTKGQGARSGAGAGIGFEGGQMPLQRRLPKYGFKSRQQPYTAEVRLSALAKIEAEPIDLAALKAANLVRGNTRRAKIIATGSLARAVVVRGLGVTRGARAAIEAAGGRVEE